MTIFRIALIVLVVVGLVGLRFAVRNMRRSRADDDEKRLFTFSCSPTGRFHDGFVKVGVAVDGGQLYHLGMVSENNVGAVGRLMLYLANELGATVQFMHNGGPVSVMFDERAMEEFGDIGPELVKNWKNLMSMLDYQRRSSTNP